MCCFSYLFLYFFFRLEDELQMFQVVMYVLKLFKPVNMNALQIVGRKVILHVLI